MLGIASLFCITGGNEELGGTLPKQLFELTALTGLGLGK